MKKILLVFVALLALSACAPSPEAIQTAVAQTQSAWTPIPTQTPYPTYTPAPTVFATRISTRIVQKLVTATPRPDFTLVHEFTGTGKGTTDLFELQTGIVRVEWEYIGSSNFAFYIRRLDNDAEDMLENTIGNASGQQIFKVGHSDQYLFDIVFARGSWNIKVYYRPE